MYLPVRDCGHWRGQSGADKLASVLAAIVLRNLPAGHRAGTVCTLPGKTEREPDLHYHANEYCHSGNLFVPDFWRKTEHRGNSWNYHRYRGYFPCKDAISEKRIVF